MVGHTILERDSSMANPIIALSFHYCPPVRLEARATIE